MSETFPDRWRVISPYLDRALDLPVEARAAWLGDLRARDPRLADELTQLLAEHEALQRDPFLETPLELPGGELSGGEAAERGDGTLAGHVAGDYTLVRRLGQGGMGSVWLANRTDGRFDGQAAIKLLHLARLDAYGEARFRREGSILSRVTHPNIAHLIDAGVSPAGQPFLVLEYVDGQSIDRYCDTRALDLPSRIRLFLDLLAAVAHAHAHLVVHRDIKAANVLVRADGQVKLLDFGIAKLLGADDVPGLVTTLTREHGAGLTPHNAAPEQVTGGPITVATDVYALGILLYELLAGQHPAGPDVETPAEMLKAIVDTDAPRPSTVVAGGTKTLPPDVAGEIAASRGSTPERLRRQLEGDLDTIVAKALKKRPSERYETVPALADDLRRYLASEPIAARADTVAYRTAKFLRRHARAVTAATIGLLLLAGIVAFYTARLAAERDRARYQAAKSEKVAEVLKDLLTSGDPYANKQQTTVKAVMDAAAERLPKELSADPELKAEILPLLGRVYYRLDLFDRAQHLLAEAVDAARRFGSDRSGEPAARRRRLLLSLAELGTLQRERGELTASIATLEEALAVARQRPNEQTQEVADVVHELGRSYVASGQPLRAEPLLRESLDIRRRVYGPEHNATLTSLGDVASLLREKGDLAGSEALFRENLAITTKVLGQRHLNRTALLNNVAIVAGARGNHAEAERLLRESLDITRELLGDTHTLVALRLTNLGSSLVEQGRFAEAQPMIDAALRIQVPALGESHPHVATSREALGRALMGQGDWKAAEAVLRQALQVRQRTFPAGDRRVATAKAFLGETLTHLGRVDEAEMLLLASYAAFERLPVVTVREPAATAGRLAVLYDATGRVQEAARYKALAARRTGSSATVP